MILSLGICVAKQVLESRLTLRCLIYCHFYHCDCKFRLKKKQFSDALFLLPSGELKCTKIGNESGPRAVLTPTSVQNAKGRCGGGENASVACVFPRELSKHSAEAFMPRFRGAACVTRAPRNL